MLLIILLGLIAMLTSVSGDCFLGTQNVNFIWNKFSGDRHWYFRLHTSGAAANNMSCVFVEYARPEGNISQITAWSYDISAQQHITLNGYATNWNSKGWEEIFPQEPFANGRSYPIAVDYDRYVIFQFCSAKSNELEVYVAYRKPFPDDETVNLVKKKLEENNIEYSQLSDWPMTNCK